MNAEEFIYIDCRHCNTQNRLLKGKAVKSVNSTICGKCRKHLFFTKDECFYDISSKSYEHPLDRKALEALKKIPGSGTVLKSILKESVEKYYRLFLLQNFIKVSKNHLGYIYDLVSHGAKILDIKQIPEVYIYQDPMPNAFTTGVDFPYIGISTSLIDLLSEEELMGVIAHELAHIHCNHVIYKTIAKVIWTVVGKIIGGGLGSMALMGIIQALLYWDRCSELSADRGELIVIKSFNSSVKTTMKLSSGSQKILDLLNIDEFLKQADEAKKEKEENLFNNIFISLQSSNVSHPFPVWRVGHLKDWAYDGEFLKIIQGNYIKKSDDENDNFNENDFKKSNDEPSLLKDIKKLIGIQ